MALLGLSPDRGLVRGPRRARHVKGAKEIEQGYADFFSKAVIDKGIVSVAPDGKDYVVAWDLQKALDLAGPPTGAVRIERFSYTLTPAGEGAWTIKADRFPSLAFDVPTDKGKATGTLDLSGFHLESAYDAAQVNFLRSLVAVELLAGKFHIADVARGADIDLAESGISVETRAKTSDSGAGVDVALAQSVKSLTETVLAPPPNGQGAPVKVTYNVGGVVGGAAITGLRAREIGDFWKYVVAHVEDADAPPEWKQRLRATLPVWNNLQANAEIHDLTLQMPMVDATLKTLGETIGLSGFVADGAAEIEVKIDELAFKSALLPSWAEQLSPASLSLDLRVTGTGLDQAAELALDDPNFGGKADLSPETQDKIGQSCSPGARRSPFRPAGSRRRCSISPSRAKPRSTRARRALASLSAPTVSTRRSPSSRTSPRPSRICRRPRSASRSSRAWRRPVPTGGWCGRSR